MAYITPEERRKNKERYDAIVLALFIDEGWDAITYERVAKQILKPDGKPITKSTLQRYYPKRVDFGRSLQGKIMPMLLPYLDFSDRSAFVQSWTHALDDAFFFMVVKMFIENAFEPVANDGAKMGTEKLLHIMSQSMSAHECQEALEEALGKTVIYALTSD